jgi:Holliday junction resolvasome RuvABC DNA-binding subunit
MKKFYVIQWKSKVNGRAGRGTKQFEKGEAEQLVAELNREYPQINHEVFEAQAAPQDQPEDQPTPTSSTTALLSIA